MRGPGAASCGGYGYSDEAGLMSAVALGLWCLVPLLATAVMALDMFAVLFGGAVAMLPAYADRVLHIGSEGLGALRAAPALGAMLTAIIFALRPMRRISAARLLWVEVILRRALQRSGQTGRHRGGDRRRRHREDIG